MPVLPDAALEGFDTKFEGFETAYATHSSRRQLAVRAANKQKIDEEYISRIQLAAHWYHGPEQLAALAQFIYGVTDNVHDYWGQPVVIISEGDIDDILAPDTDRLESDVSATFGIIRERESIFHDFDVYSRPGQPGFNGIKPPVIRTKMGLFVRRPYELYATTEGDGEVWDADLCYDDGILPVYEAVIPLEHERYGETISKEHTAVFGMQRAFQLLQALQRKGLPGIEEQVGFPIAA